MNIKIDENIAIINGKNINKYTVTNNKGLSVSVLNLGGIINSIVFPDKKGNTDNLVLGFDDVTKYGCKDYLDNYPYWGAICGRVANRIGNGSFSLNNVEYQLNKNNNGSHLHGGIQGFDRKIWNVSAKEASDNICLHLSYTSPDNEENYPGTLSVCVDYFISNNNTITINYHATTDKTTIVNLTNHTYFNLTGNQKDISRMSLQVFASKYTPLNDLLVPTGEIATLTNTNLDLHNPTTFEDGLKKLPQGYDFNYILEQKNYLKKACSLFDEVSKRKLTVFTSQPALQVYSGYYIPEIDGKFGRFSGVALETQHYPDAPNNPSFPSITLEPKKIYREMTVWKFER